MNINQIIDRLFEHFKVYTISQLATELGVKQPILSGWKSRNSIKSFKNKCREMGIYEEIFNDEEIKKDIHIDTITRMLIQELKNCNIDEDELQIELLKLVQKLKKIKTSDRTTLEEKPDNLS